MDKIKEIIKLVFKNTIFKLGVNSMDYLPRWIILFWDIQVAFFALVSAAFIINNFSLQFLDSLFLQQVILAEVVTVIFFLIFKTYVGVIRHSTNVDAVKLFLAALLTAIALVVIDFAWFSVFEFPCIFLRLLAFCYNFAKLL